MAYTNKTTAIANSIRSSVASAVAGLMPKDLQHAWARMLKPVKRPVGTLLSTEPVLVPHDNKGRAMRLLPRASRRNQMRALGGIKQWGATPRGHEPLRRKNAAGLTYIVPGRHLVLPPQIINYISKV